jgi:3-oxoacyl-[acyl-carrier protein] reductase
MRLIYNIFRFIPRLWHTARMIRKYWRDGDVVKVNIAQIQYGGILKGKNILVTGGSSGIGLAIARKCLTEGALVVITGRNEEKLKLAVLELDSPMIRSLVWDVSNISKHEEKFNEALNLCNNRIDILVNNAGLLGGNRQFLDLTEKVWDDIYSVNSKGLVFITKCFVQKWINDKQRGKIINMSSMRGTLGVQDGPYGMSKWSLNGLTHGLGLKLAPLGIIVNGIAPGIINTESIALKNINSKENVYLSEVPVSRIGLPEEIAELAIFLMSDAANYIIGQTIICDGGYTLKV